MSCIEPRITTLKQYEKLSQKISKDLLTLHQIMHQEKQHIDQLTQICTDTLAQEPTITCTNCGSTNTANRMGILYTRFKCRQEAHTPYYSVCRDCNKVITPTPEQKQILAQFVTDHPTRYEPEEVTEAHNYLHKHPITKEE